ncbi:membrane protein [Sulfurifustis variabilis]|uniref:Probable membrane transporter protein n=1 Tax=Sulfurifustis variabilis TaxID=1675686 RepID=A0A1B4VDX7_9GAMM|nr:sulfite exporter TauE/SafE family protein [Sulfurifustis variabilis]BAU48757.1 membrane protein [Sulfurifustis variabilis]
MYFATAGIEVQPWIPPLVAFVISVFTSMGGVAGAVLLLPFQVSVLGFVSPSVTATNILYNLVAIPGGVYRFVRDGRLLWPLAWAIAAATLPGVFLGAWVRVNVLVDPRAFKLFAALVLLYVGVRMLQALLADRQSPRPELAAGADSRLESVRFDRAHIAFAFKGQVFRIRIAALAGLGFAVGLVGGAYGIGGGGIIAPMLVGLYRLPAQAIAGAALWGTFVTSLGAVLFYHALAPFHPELAVSPDWALGLLFGLGGAAGVYVGARLQRVAPSALIKGVLAVCLLVPALYYVREFLNG